MFFDDKFRVVEIEQGEHAASQSWWKCKTTKHIGNILAAQ